MDDRELVEVLHPFNFWRAEPFTGIERPRYVAAIERLASTGQVVVVTGVRRCGKTTVLLQFLQHLINAGIVRPQETMYVNLEDPRFDIGRGTAFLDQLMAAHRAFVDPDGVRYLVLDEVQRLAGWERWVRIRMESRPETRILVTGSSSHLLSRELATLLTGRHLDLEVFPLDLAEYLTFRGVDPNDPLVDPERAQAVTSEYLSSSAFPRIVLTSEPDLRERMVLAVYRDILDHDVIRRNRIREPEKLESVATHLVSSVPGPVTFNAVKRALGGRVSLDSVERFSRQLEEPYLLFFLRTHDFSAAGRERLPRKVYSVDNGILLACAHRFSSDRGRLLENAVFIDLRRFGLEVYRWRDRKEVDFIVWHRTEPVAAINACAELADSATRSREVDGLRAAMERFGLDKGTIVTISQREDIPVDEGVIRVVPYRMWALDVLPSLMDGL